jgi:hypothetical protein
MYPDPPAAFAAICKPLNEDSMHITEQQQRFLDNMKSYGLGDVLRKLSERQDAVVSAVNDTGLPGEITLNLKFKRVGQHGMAVVPKVTAKVPEKPMQSVEMYVKDNKLYEDNPDQMNIENVHQIDVNKKVNQA